ncbi:MAG: MATE family efflux transporter [Hyphomicrobiaceae bacterium]
MTTVHDGGATATRGQRIGHAEMLRIALPITLSNATVPLIGFVDTTVIGQTGDAALMGAVAVGALIFNMLYWSFSFLRMGTTGLTAQALGADDRREVAGHLLRALMVASVAGLAMLVLQRPLRGLCFWLTGGSAEVVAAGYAYFDIRIWAAPSGLVNFAVLGWLIGLGRAGVAFALQLFLNILNIVLAVAFTLGLSGGIAGVAWAALVSETAGAAAGLVAALRLARGMQAAAPLRDAVDLTKLSRSLAINTDLTIRSLAGYVALLFFTSRGAAVGDATLAGNALLVNMKSIVIYLLDGFAFAAEALVGRCVGARDRAGFWRAVEVSTIWAGAFAVVVSAILWFAGPAIIAFSAKSPQVQAVATSYLAWAAISPLLGVWCFQLDGIFTGATRTADMRNMMVLSVAIFLALSLALVPWFGNHGLWAAFMVLYITRAITLGARLPALVRSAFGGA